MNKMPKIGGLQNAAYYINKDIMEPEYWGTGYIPKVKLHGTNAGIRIQNDGTIVAQSKNRDLAIGDDNHGFAAFVETLDKKSLYGRAQSLGGIKELWDNITLMGEWAGPGIQSGVGISQLPEKRFFVFAVFEDRSDYLNGEFEHIVHYDSFTFWRFCYLFLGNSQVHFLPVIEKEKVWADFRKQDDKARFAERCNAFVERINEQCPVSSELGYTGIGEGAVYYPLTPNGQMRKSTFERYAFKVKGEDHAVNKAGRPARIKSDIPDTVFQFVDFQVTEARLEQALQEIGGGLDNKNIGPFLSWIAKDIQEECKLEIEESGFDWKKHLSGPIATRARIWFMEKQKTV